eukprot:3808959-Alexandrium_andersonii.AAC.1
MRLRVSKSRRRPPAARRLRRPATTKSQGVAPRRVHIARGSNVVMVGAVPKQMAQRRRLRDAAAAIGEQSVVRGR